MFNAIQQGESLHQAVSDALRGQDQRKQHRMRTNCARQWQVRRAQRGAGFTLLEILVVIAILGLLIGLAAPAALRQLGGARISVAKQSIERLGGILDIYKLDTGSYPMTEQGLQALVTKPSDVAGWNGPYTRSEGVPLDPWKHEYVYRNPSTRSGHEYDLCSLGPNGTSEGSDNMICND